MYRPATGTRNGCFVLLFQTPRFGALKNSHTGTAKTTAKITATTMVPATGTECHDRLRSAPSSGQEGDHSDCDHRYQHRHDQPKPEGPWRPSQRPYVPTACARQAATDHACPLYPALHRQGAVLRQPQLPGCGSAVCVRVSRHGTIMQESITYMPRERRAVTTAATAIPMATANRTPGR